MPFASLVLLNEEGTGAFNSWNDILTLTRRTNGQYYLSLRRLGIDTSGSVTLYRSMPFRRPARLLDALQCVIEGSEEWFYRPLVFPADVVSLLSRLVEFDPPLVGAALAELARRLATGVHQPKECEA